MQTDVFWKAAVLTVIILVIGIAIGVWIDSGRVEEVKTTLTENDLLLNDVRLQTIYYEDFLTKNPELCDIAFRANLEYNNKIYQEGLKLEKYEQHNKFSSSLILERKRYALQQMQFWINSIKIKDFCKYNYTTALYMFIYDTGNSSEIELPQKLQSAALLELKENCGSALMLSPISIDLNLTAIKMLTETYNITRTPAIIIDRQIVLQGFQDMKNLEEHIKC
ncbi:MAG: hypothetical protein HZB65_03515 [Candidatus Aenigmarchaeota archaeon]|nr:hypothetical protein [Candidatus Aenigmarchaeota archaeon]